MQTELIVDHPGAACISECGMYRYTLDRSWHDGDGTCVFIMLNPSTADALQDDPTIRRCIGFARNWGFGSLRVLNLFAFRATDPKRLQMAGDPIGPENDFQIIKGCENAQLIVLAWGNHGTYLRRGAAVVGLLYLKRHQLFHLGLSKTGQPKHPLYLKKDLKPIRLANPR